MRRLLIHASPCWPLLLVCFLGCESSVMVLRNPALRTVRADFPGNTLRDGRFVSEYTSDIGRSFGPFLRWQLSRNPKREAKRADAFALEVRRLDHLPPSDRDYLIWLGHASFLIHLNGQTLLTDPCLTAPPTVARRSALPLDIHTVSVDFVLVSHGHFDHLDLASLAMLRGGPNLTALVPLRLGPLVAFGRPGIRIQEAGWYQVFDTPGGLDITLLPAMHWNRRSLRDFNQALWGSFLIRWKGRSIYFAGDTGYQTHFKEVPKLLGPVDIALLPIGAYDPPFIMRPSHLDPEEALQACVDLQAQCLVPMHYGTFDLSDEPQSEPLQRLRTAALRRGLGSSLRPLAVGEVQFLD